MKKMKKILFPILSLAVFMVGCDVKSAMDEDLYPQKVYIKGVGDRIIEVDIDIAQDVDEATISVLVSGSRPSTEAVTATIIEVPESIVAYNFRERAGNQVQYQAPPSYSFPSDKVTIPKGQIYQTYPIEVGTEEMHCDSLYMIALQLIDPSAYEVSRERTDSIALVRFHLVNEFSGQYNMNGTIRVDTLGSDALEYLKPRVLTATDDGRTVRMYHFENEAANDTDNNPNNDYRRLKTFKFTVNEDNTLSYDVWQDFQIVDGGGEYNEEMDLFDMWYTYRDSITVNNVREPIIYRTEGFLYKERKTADETRLMLDWIEEQRLLREPAVEE